MLARMRAMGPEGARACRGRWRCCRRARPSRGWSPRRTRRARSCFTTRRPWTVGAAMASTSVLALAMSVATTLALVPATARTVTAHASRPSWQGRAGSCSPSRIGVLGRAHSATRAATGRRRSPSSACSRGTSSTCRRCSVSSSSRSARSSASARRAMAAGAASPWPPVVVAAAWGLRRAAGVRAERGSGRRRTPSSSAPRSVTSASRWLGARPTAITTAPPPSSAAATATTTIRSRSPDAIDVPGNGIDEDCSGADLPAAEAAPRLRRPSRARPSRTT